MLAHLVKKCDFLFSASIKSTGLLKLFMKLRLIVTACVLGTLFYIKNVSVPIVLHACQFSWLFTMLYLTNAFDSTLIKKIYDFVWTWSTPCKFYAWVHEIFY
jgi:hypothetical protein